MPSVFISHSSADKDFARKLTSALRKSGIEVWIDEAEIKGGSSLFDRISAGLIETDYLVVILSPNSVSSEWVNREINSALLEEIEKKQVRVIPVLYKSCEIPVFLRPKLYLDFRDTENDTNSFEVGVSRIINAISDPCQQTQPSHKRMFELMYLLLLIDQFENGIWGASLESSVDLYGHGYDPGSISISTFSSFAITQFTGSRNAVPIQKYRAYLQDRQSARGAFGMKREIGTKKYPQSEILEHARHTATGLSFFLFYDGFDHNRVARALTYLLNARTAKGSWVDVGSRANRNADPITVAFVIDSLEQVHWAVESRFSKNEEDHRMLDQLNENILAGLKYIFNCPLRTSEGFWYYKYSTQEEKARVLQNLYQYTTDVLSSIASSCKRMGRYLEELDDIQRSLFSIAQAHFNGLPRSPETHVPSLDATSRLILTARKFVQWKDLAGMLYESLPKLCADEQVLVSGCANGWSSVLLLSPFPESANYEHDDRTAELNGLAQALREGDPEAVKLPLGLERYSKFVRGILRRNKGTQPL